MLSLLLIIAAGETPARTAALIAKAGEMTAAEHRCVPDPDSSDITVCGLRNADRFRVPFIVHDDGDPRYEAVAAERQRLLHRTTPVQDMGPFLVEGGMAGMSVGTAGITGATHRKLAP